MTTTTPSPTNRRHQAGYTLVEIIVSATITGFVLIGVLSAFLFIGRSSVNIANYTDMEDDARVSLEFFAQDAREASALTWNSANSVTFAYPAVINRPTVTYAFNSGTKTFTRTVSGTTTTLIRGITSFNFVGYGRNRSGNEIEISSTNTTNADLSTSDGRTKANGLTMQLQLSLRCSRTSTTVQSATNTVLSAKYLLRNKISSTTA